MVERSRDFETQLLILNLITMDEDKEFTLDNAEKFGKYYTEESFWKKLKKFAVKAGNKVVYPALLLYYVLVSRDVPVKDKGLIIGALGYLILPIDLIPDFIPVAGFADDAAALAAVLKMVASNVDEEIEAKAKAKADELFGLH